MLRSSTILPFVGGLNFVGMRSPASSSAAYWKAIRKGKIGSVNSMIRSPHLSNPFVLNSDVVRIN